ncbi:hypothetical protein [Sorangium sp. So ce542]|uniref:hypothetical protein n=1 Tax=Sorangium sp. So ce542 TaxID=3133316 RepID=UPI003F63F49C
MVLSRWMFVGLSFAGALGSSHARALPSVEQAGALEAVGDAKRQGSPIALADHERDDLFYLPFDRVFLQPLDDAGRPQFGLTYDEEGGLLGLTVAAGYSEAARRLAERLRSEDKTVVPLVPSSGQWNLTIQQKDGTSFVIGTTDRIETSLPSIPVALSASLPKAAIAYIVSSFRTGAGVGVNYTYKFRGARNAVTFRASVNWTQARSYIKTQQIDTSGSCTSVSASGVLSWVNIGASYKACKSDISNIRKITQSLVEKQVIKIYSLGTATGELKNVIDTLTKLVATMTFRPTLQPSQRLPDAVPQGTECDAGNPRNTPMVAGIQLFVGHCSVEGHNYVYDEEIQFENKEYVYTVQADEYQDYTGAVGANFGDLCVSQPQFFVNARSGAEGCPTRWGDRGIETHLTTGPAPVLAQPGAKLSDAGLGAPTSIPGLSLN